MRIIRMMVNNPKRQLHILNLYYKLASGIKLKMMPASIREDKYSHFPLGHIHFYVFNKKPYFSRRALLAYFRKKKLNHERFTVKCECVPVRILGKYTSREELEPWIQKLRRKEFYYISKKTIDKNTKQNIINNVL